MKKAQTAVEFLTTYGWVIFAAILLILILYTYGFFNVTGVLPNQCTFDPNLPCVSYRFQEREIVLPPGGGLGTPMRFFVQLSNNLGYDIALSNNSAAIHVENIGKPGKQTYLGNCSPKLPYVIKKGEVFTCTFEIYDREAIPSTGKKLNFQVELNYTNCFSDPNYLVNGSCMLGTNHTSTGNVITPMERYTQPTYFCGDGFCIGDETPFNCPADCPPPTTIILTALPNIVTPDGEQFSVIIAKVLNKTGSPMANIEVSFSSIPIGNLSSYLNTTNSSGETSVLLKSKQSGVAKVTATAIISNETTVTFRAIPAKLLLTAYDRYLGKCGGGSYIIANVLDAGNKPIKDIEVSFSHNATGTSSLSPSPEITNEGGLAVAYFTDNKLEKVNITARADMDEFGVHLLNSTLVEVVECQACNAPVKGDWIIDKKVVCEDATITLNGNLNISVEIGYIKKWGDLTFRNVKLIFNGSYQGERGVFMNRESSFLISDKDNNPLTTWDSSNITSSSYRHYTFWVKPNARSFEMRNSYISHCGFNVSSRKDREAYKIVDYRTGLFISINNTVIQGNTFRGDGTSLIGVVLNYSNNNSIQRNVFDSLYTALYLNNSNNNFISNNTINALWGFYYGSDWSEGTINPSIWLIRSSNNTVSKNFIDGNSVITGFAGPAIQLEEYSSGNQIVENYMEECDDELTLHFSNQNNISNNRIRDFHFFGVDMLYADFNIFENNEINNSEYNYGFIPIEMIRSSGNIFINNSLQTIGCSADGGGEIRLTGSPNNTFIDNNLYGCWRIIRNTFPNIYDASENISIIRLNLNQEGSYKPSYKIYLINTPGAVLKDSKNIDYVLVIGSPGTNISNNTIVGSGVNITDSSLVRVENNNFTGSPSYAVYISNSTAEILNNTMGPASPACMWNGILSLNSSFVIANNTIRRFVNYGIYTEYPSEVSYIQNNSIFNSCGGNGLFLKNSNNVNITGNVISSSIVGVNFTLSNYPTNITNNTITSNTYGIHCYSYTTQPTLSNNYFSGNFQNCLGCVSCG
ncbi:MAG: right-handed parallel beta-helix repeat-containing protein [Candidatus Micrarchaeia archaeon]